MIDRWKAWHQIGARIERTTDERHRGMLECVRTLPPAEAAAARDDWVI